MEKINLEEKVCLLFCSYYKPTRNDNLACLGYTILEKFLQKGDEIIFKKYKTPINATAIKLLRDNMCIHCPFFKEDCDFIQHYKDSLPCGGFILLGHLLKEGLITIDNIIDIIYTFKYCKC